jgi:2,3-bisphosphoglycerate-dependent phosphoglycerate mutase
MLEVVFIRHGATEWNQQKRIQGHTDIPLSREGREILLSWQLPPSWRAWSWYVSPLQRARETALILGLDARVEPLLIEMNWGAWEGKILEELPEPELRLLRLQEARGLDMTAPGGESPRQVQQRLQQWATQLSAQGLGQVGAVCHKGIIRALLAEACGWDMIKKPPYKLNYSRPQRFRWDGRRWYLVDANLKSGEVFLGR